MEHPSIGEVFAQMRFEKAMRKTDLAKQMKTSIQAVSAVEKGKIATIRKMKKFAEALGYKVRIVFENGQRKLEVEA